MIASLGPRTGSWSSTWNIAFGHSSCLCQNGFLECLLLQLLHLFLGLVCPPGPGTPCMQMEFTDACQILSGEFLFATQCLSNYTGLCYSWALRFVTNPTFLWDQLSCCNIVRVWWDYLYVFILNSSFPLLFKQNKTKNNWNMSMGEAKTTTGSIILNGWFSSCHPTLHQKELPRSEKSVSTLSFIRTYQGGASSLISCKPFFRCSWYHWECDLLPSPDIIVSGQYMVLCKSYICLYNIYKCISYTQDTVCKI